MKDDLPVQLAVAALGIGMLIMALAMGAVFLAPIGLIFLVYQFFRWRRARSREHAYLRMLIVAGSNGPTSLSTMISWRLT